MLQREKITGCEGRRVREETKRNKEVKESEEKQSKNRPIDRMTSRCILAVYRSHPFISRLALPSERHLRRPRT